MRLTEKISMTGYVTVLSLWGMTAQVFGGVYVPPEGLVKGAAFIDRFEPVPLVGKLRSDVWGAERVLPRDVDNGIEDSEYSYWGGNIVKGDDGIFHMFVCRWTENNRKGKASGHHTWWDSTVVRAVSEDPLGPYNVVQEIGKGHNPEIYQLKDGSYIIGVMGRKFYKAEKLEGPWKEMETTFEFLEKVQKQPGIREHDNETNRTYVLRDDGSVLMMNKTGYVFISENADEHFVQVADRSAYPFLPEPAHLEDPVIWKDEVQYNLIVNDCVGRVAIYLRSPDGLSWRWEQGVAYDRMILKHPDGTTENWRKFERPKVLQDEYGRAAFMNFATIDSLKSDDKADDNHSSKNIVVPLRVPRRLKILNREPITADTKEIRLLIKAEDGFLPLEQADLDSLTFGADTEVNFGRGCKPIDSEPLGNDLVVTFNGRGNGISEDNFTAKLIGRDKSGELLFGYAELP